MKLRTEATKGKYKGFLNIMQVRDLKKKRLPSAQDFVVV